MSDYPRLHPDELEIALCLFWYVGLNTAEIARDLYGTKDYEPSVANSLAAEREERRKARAA